MKKVWSFIGKIICLFLYLCVKLEDEVKEDWALADKAMAKIAKNRNGKLESFAFEVDNNIQKWIEVSVLDNKPWVPVPRVEKPIVNYSEPSNKDADEEMPF